MPGRLRRCPEFRASPSTARSQRRANCSGWAFAARCSLEFQSHKDAVASSNYDPQGVVHRAARAIAAALPEMLARRRPVQLRVHRPRPLRNSRRARRRRQRRDRRRCWRARRVTYAEAGIDVVAPSDMMDGRVDAIRERARRARLDRRRDHGVQREVRVGVLRPVSRGRRVDAGVRRPAHATRWIRPTCARRCARSRSTSTKAPTS